MVFVSVPVCCWTLVCVMCDSCDPRPPARGRRLTGNPHDQSRSQLLATEPLGAHATKHRVDVKLNGHWTDTVHEAPPSSNNSNTHHGQRGGGVRGRGVGGRGGGGWRGGRGGGGGRGYEPDAKRRRYG